jgi:hypothetical protein
MVCDVEFQSALPCDCSSTVTNLVFNDADRELKMIAPKGRPVKQCEHCRSARKDKSHHAKCDCGSKKLKDVPESEPKSEQPACLDWVQQLIESSGEYGLLLPQGHRVCLRDQERDVRQETGNDSPPTNNAREKQALPQYKQLRPKLIGSEWPQT